MLKSSSPLTSILSVCATVLVASGCAKQVVKQGTKLPAALPSLEHTFCQLETDAFIPKGAGLKVGQDTLFQVYDSHALPGERLHIKQALKNPLLSGHAREEIQRIHEEVKHNNVFGEIPMSHPSPDYPPGEEQYVLSTSSSGDERQPVLRARTQSHGSVFETPKGHKVLTYLEQTKASLDAYRPQTVNCEYNSQRMVLNTSNGHLLELNTTLEVPARTGKPQNSFEQKGTGEYGIAGELRKKVVHVPLNVSNARAFKESVDKFDSRMDSKHLPKSKAYGQVAR
jgi:hypothetical protein